MSSFDSMYSNPAGYLNPQKLWSFEVSFVMKVDDDSVSNEELKSASGEIKELQDILDELPYCVSKVSYSPVSVTRLDTYFPGMSYTYPGVPKLNGELKIDFYDDESLSIRAKLTKLMELFGSMDFQTDSETTCYSKSKIPNELKYIDIYLKVLNDRNEVTNNIVFKHCALQSLGGVELDYKNGAGAIDVNATFSYVYHKVLETMDEVGE